MEAVGYARVSTDKQSRDGLSLGAQEKAIRRYCELYDISLNDMLVDRGVSAKSIKGRPAMEVLLTKVRDRDVECVVVYKIDRMFRSIRDALNTFDLFKENHVQFHSVIEKWDTSTAMGEFAMNMLLSIAQLERRQTSERTRFTLREKKVANSRQNAVMAHRTDKGILTVGRAPYGWKWENKILIENPIELNAVKQMISMKKEGKKIGDIIIWLKMNNLPSRNGGAWHKKQIYRILSAEYYEG